MFIAYRNNLAMTYRDDLDYDCEEVRVQLQIKTPILSLSDAFISLLSSFPNDLYALVQLEIIHNAT